MMFSYGEVALYSKEHLFRISLNIARKLACVCAAELNKTPSLEVSVVLMKN